MARRLYPLPQPRPPPAVLCIVRLIRPGFFRIIQLVHVCRPVLRAKAVVRPGRFAPVGHTDALQQLAQRARLLRLCGLLQRGRLDGQRLHGSAKHTAVPQARSDHHRGGRRCIPVPGALHGPTAQPAHHRQSYVLLRLLQHIPGKQSSISRQALVAEAQMLRGFQPLQFIQRTVDEGLQSLVAQMAVL